jgi:diguanylate cyclase (GGDEF)-like protein/PAS domain S-box-containing protein
LNSYFNTSLSRLNKIAFRFVFIYLLFGLAWILFSDNILPSAVSNYLEFKHYSVYKGLAFICTTACLLYFLLRKTLKQQMEIEASLKISEERWKFALEGAGDGVWDWNLQSDEVFRSARWHQIFGYDPADVPNTATDGRKLIHPDDLQQAIDKTEAYLNGMTDSYVSEFRIRCKDGSWKWVLGRGMLVSRTKDGKPLRMIGTHTDISAHKHSEAQIFRLAHYDQVTKLPNRILFLDRLEQDIKNAKRNHQIVTLLFLDLDHFKEVNDTLGHDIGDSLLKEAAQRLSDCVRDTDTVARLGGDEFTIILNNLDQQNNAEIVAQKILESIAKPFQLGGESVYISTSIGISVYPEDGLEVDILLKNADQAMYAAKELGRNRYYYFKPSMQESALHRMRLTSDLRIALAEKQFRLYYQPILELATNRLHKAEALIRWQHPARGLVSPVEFIPVAEDSGLIIDIGDWVFREATAQVAKWRRSRPDFQISVNKSPVQFRTGNRKTLPWTEHMASLGLAGDSIAVEITEGLLLDARDTVVQQLDVLRTSGFQISIDDFGTGYSSLAYLRKFRIDYVKIDRSFTANIAPGSSDMALCEAIIVMAHKLDMKVIAEGIETQEQLDLLIAADCDYGQGYLFSRPLPPDEFEKLL